MTHAVTGQTPSETLQPFLRDLATVFEAEGFARCADPWAATLVLNVTSTERPSAFPRRARGSFVVAIVEGREDFGEQVGHTYPVLVRALANIVLCYVPGRGVWITTLERGHYLVPADAVVSRVAPLARARLVIDNEFRPDLEPALWEGDDLTRDLASAGARLGRLGLLPAPFPLSDLLDEQGLRYIRRLYGIGGLSYGNLSVRKDPSRYWMSASGVDKAHLSVPRDIVLVSGCDVAGGRVILSVPPGPPPNRVSVDAVEHWMIYQTHPPVGAIIHVHAWIEGTVATEINFPCGTAELARSVADLLAAEPDPAHAVIGLKNHGITATGESPGEILNRIESRLLTEVPMS